MDILITRPESDSHILKKQLLELDSKLAIDIWPIYSISPHLSQQNLDLSLDIDLDNKISHTHIIFVSPNAVKYFLDFNFIIQNINKIKLYCVGSKTAASLFSKLNSLAPNISPNILYPKTQSGSKGLLNLIHKKIKNLDNQFFYLICGNHTKKFLPDQLIKLGASIKMIECYQKNYNHSIPDFIINKNKSYDLIITMTQSSIEFIYYLFKNKNLINNLNKFQSSKVISVSEEMTEWLIEHDFKSIIPIEPSQLKQSLEEIIFRPSLS